MKKTRFILLLAISLVLCSFSGIVSANQGVSLESEIDFGEVLQHVEELTGNGATNQDIVEFLNSQNIEVLASNSVIVDEEGKDVNVEDLDNEFSIFALDTSCRKITNWITKSGSDYYAWVQVDRVPTLPANATFENYPASYDVVSINWDPKKFDYVSNGISNNNVNIWLSDADQRFSGSLLFSMYDNIDYGNVSSVTAYVRLSKKGTGVTTTGVKYTHTFDTTKKSSSYSGNAKWTWGKPLEIGVSYTVNTTDKEDNWPKAATADITL